MKHPNLSMPSLCTQPSPPSLPCPPLFSPPFPLCPPLPLLPPLPSLPLRTVAGPGTKHLLPQGHPLDPHQPRAQPLPTHHLCTKWCRGTQRGVRLFQQPVRAFTYTNHCVYRCCCMCQYVPYGRKFWREDILADC